IIPYRREVDHGLTHGCARLEEIERTKNLSELQTGKSLRALQAQCRQADLFDRNCTESRNIRQELGEASKALSSRLTICFLGSNESKVVSKSPLDGFIQ